MIKSISCIGFRGFSTKQTLDLALPNGKPGSGLTIVVGPNGGGKSTLVECFLKISQANKNASFSKGKRNIISGGNVEIEISFDDQKGILRTINGGSETEWVGINPPKIYYLPSRRFFNPYFSKLQWNRDAYLNNPQSMQYRSSSLDTYTSRLVDLNEHGSDSFNQMLERILGHPFSWTIDQEDNGQYIVSIKKKGRITHNSDGLGEGILSLMFVADSLCGPKEEIVVIDEPELSLHPQLQIRLLKEIVARAKDSQVVISTHSPNMLSLDAVINNGMVARVYEDDDGTKICTIDNKSRKFITSVENDINNPHVLGLDARSCFFAEDCLIITEGQEDVVLYPSILRELEKEYSLPFFGFGAGGASKIVEVAHLLQVLGFKKVGAIFDGDKKKEYDAFVKEFNTVGFRAWIIPAGDIRDKQICNTQVKTGLLDVHKKLKEEYRTQLSTMFDDVASFVDAKLAARAQA